MVHKGTWYEFWARRDTVFFLRIRFRRWDDERPLAKAPRETMLSRMWNHLMWNFDVDRPRCLVVATTACISNSLMGCVGPWETHNRFPLPPHGGVRYFMDCLGLIGEPNMQTKICASVRDVPEHVLEVDELLTGQHLLFQVGQLNWDWNTHCKIREPLGRLAQFLLVPFCPVFHHHVHDDVVVLQLSDQATGIRSA